MLVVNTTFCIIGAAGSLATTRLLPALLMLLVENPEKKFCIVLVDKHEFSRTILREKITSIFSDQQLQRIAWERIFFVEADMTTQAGVEKFAIECTRAERMNAVDGRRRLFYFACSPALFCPITTRLAATNLMYELRNSSGWVRYVFEKPFGFDVTSARKLQACLKTFLKEHEIIRVDHYLRKEMIKSVLMLRSANRIFSECWSKEHIASIEISLLERETVENRAALYDQLGVIRDVVQSHLLTTLALITIPLPDTAPSLELFNQIRDQLAECSVKKVLRAQYQGYQSLPNVKQHSSTETYALLECSIANKAWSGVPFYLRAGKGMSHDETSITVNFKPTACRYAHCSLATNQLQLLLSPTPELRIRLYVHQQGPEDQLLPIELSSGEQLCCIPLYEAYKTLLAAILNDDPYVSIPFECIEQAWLLLEPVFNNPPQLLFYNIGKSVPADNNLQSIALDVK